MVLVIALPDLAKRVCAVVPDAIGYVVSVDSPSDLRHRVYTYQPDIVLLDSRMGGSSWMAIEEVPAIVGRTESHPYVIMLLPWTTEEVEREAVKRQCYDVVSVASEDFESDVWAAVQTARKARLARDVPRRAVRRKNYH